MEVVKIRLQAQQHSLADPLEVPRYRNAAHALYTIIKEEGFLTLYRGVALTAARQATNQGTFDDAPSPYLRLGEFSWLFADVLPFIASIPSQPPTSLPTRSSENSHNASTARPTFLRTRRPPSVSFLVLSDPVRHLPLPFATHTSGIILTLVCFPLILFVFSL